MYSSVQPSHLSDQIVKQIQSLILEGELSPGDKLPSERELANRMNVSRSAVREAVKTLRERGLVEILSGRGTFVANYHKSSAESLHTTLALLTNDQNSSEDLIQIRAILEPAITAIACKNLTEDELAQLEAIVAEMDDSMDDPSRFVTADLEFHNLLANGTRNELISILLKPILTLLRDQRERIFKVSDGPSRGQFHHKKILAALKNRDAEAAANAMAAHIQQVKEDSGDYATQILPNSAFYQNKKS